MKIFLILVLATLLSSCGGTSSDLPHQRPAPQPSTQTNLVPEVCRPAEQNNQISQGGKWQLVWADEFDGRAIDGSKWQYETNCAGGGNNELQCYVEDDANAFVAKGQLHIVALNQPVTGDSGWFGNSGNVVSRDYSSARLRTLNLADWRYGRFEIRAKLPYGQGVWPAIWMLPTDYAYGKHPLSGEIDIMEVINLRTDTENNNRLHGTLHFSDEQGKLKSAGSAIVPITDMTTEFHNYAIEWEAGEIRWYIDEQLYFTQKQTDWMTCSGEVKQGFQKTAGAPFDQNFHLILNLAVGGGWAGDLDASTSWPQEMVIEHVRVYQCASDPENGHGCSTLETATKPRLVGYLPGYKGLTESIKNVDLHNLTHLNLSFANPNAEGDFLLNENLLCMPGSSTEHVKGDEIHEVVERAHQAGVKVLMSVAGGVIPSCSGDWHRLLQSENRPQLVSKLINLLTDFNLDGLDIDLEGILLTQIDNAGNYTPFIQALSAQLKPQGKLLTSATASYEGGMIPIDSIPYFDFVNIMSYDAIGPSWGQAGIEHSTYQQAVQDVQLWLDRGLTKQQLVLGLPFYGYGFGQYRSDYQIKDLVTLYGRDVLQKDIVGDLCAGCDYITYNGLVTLQAKTELALKHGSGVMIWELSHDSSSSSNILATIASQVAAAKTP